MYRHSKDFITSGLPLDQANQVIVMIHGRGATPESIISLASHLKLDDAALLAPRATNNSWYPYSFLAPVEENQPALDSALELIGQVVEEVQEKGFRTDQIYFLGFSQGACLSLEYVARNAARYGGLIAFTGGLIGDNLNLANYQGNFGGTPVLITTGDPDPHVPVTRVEETAQILEAMQAEVTVKIYDGRAHTIQLEELQLANRLVLGS